MLTAKNKWSLIMETEDINCQAVDTKKNKQTKTRDNGKQLETCLFVYCFQVMLHEFTEQI